MKQSRILDAVPKSARSAGPVLGLVLFAGAVASLAISLDGLRLVAVVLLVGLICLFMRLWHVNDHADPRLDWSRMKLRMVRYLCQYLDGSYLVPDRLTVDGPREGSSTDRCDTDIEPLAGLMAYVFAPGGLEPLRQRLDEFFQQDELCYTIPHPPVESDGPEPAAFSFEAIPHDSSKPALLVRASTCEFVADHYRIVVRPIREDSH